MLLFLPCLLRVRATRTLRMLVNLKQVPQVVLSRITIAKGMLQTKIVATTKTLFRVRVEKVLAPESESVLRHSR